VNKSERERALVDLYRAVNTAKLEIEAGMDELLEKGLTQKASVPLLEIMEITLKLIREKATAS